MLKNYIKVAFRNITKHKFFSIINILGLTIGLAASLFITLYIYDELTYDQFNAKADRTYRMNLHGKLAGQEIYTSNTSFPMSQALVEEIPEVEEATRVNPMGEWIIRNGTISFNEEDVFAVDSNFFSVFSFELLYGNPETALIEPNSIILSEDLAVKYFGEPSDALDKSLSIGNDKSEYKVTGVVENRRSDSHLKFNILLSTSTFPWMNQGNWLSNSLYTYYVIAEGADPKDVDAKLEPIMELNVTPVMQQFVGKSLAEFRETGGIYEYYSFPMLDIHLKSDI
ncbi:MAG: ABC transporter permease, partial [Fulvivirga sp.]